jgi:signal transduction histidine kinase
MEQSPYPIVIFNPEGHIEQVNPAWYRVWGVNEEQGEQVMEVYNIVADQQLADLGMTPLIKKAFEGQSVVLPPIQYAGGQGTEELGLPQVGGNTVWIQTLLYPVKDEQGKISFVVNTVVDVTKEKEAENRAMAKQEQLQESEARFRSLMEQSPYAIEILNPEGRIEQYNAAWLRLWSVTEEQARITREEYNMLTAPQTVDLGVAAQIKKAFDGEPVVLPPIKYSPAQTSEDFELPFLTDRLRTPWIQCHVFPVKDQAGKVDFVVNTYVDITEQKEAVDQIEAHRERLRALAAELTRTEEQERRRIATELHDGAAQSLAFARLQLTAAQKACADELAADKLTEISQILKESVQQIRAVLLDLSSPALNEIGLSAALSEWLDEHVGRRHDLGTSFVDECGEVPLGRDMRALVFRDARELITNAVKHAEAKNVSVHMAVSDQRLRIVVEDDGQGFDSHAVGQMPGDEGGFGLFSIRERMADVGGRFEIESAPGKGCKATLIVPLEDDTI